MQHDENTDKAWNRLWELFPAERIASQRLLERMEYTFTHPPHFWEAMTHRSAVASNSAEGKLLQREFGIALPWNERLEFLGDAVLGLILSTALWHKDPSWNEGQLSKTRSRYVSEVSLARIARDLELGSALVLGKGERKAGGGNRDSLIASALEAVIGALYLDGGFVLAEQVVQRWFAPYLVSEQPPTEIDYKSELQEFAQEHYRVTPKYRTLQTDGPAHSRTFVVAVVLGDRQLGTGTGISKKKAAQDAAEQSLKLLRQQR